MIYLEQECYGEDIKELFYNKVKSKYLKKNSDFETGNIKGLVQLCQKLIGKDLFNTFFSNGSDEEKFRDLILMPPHKISEMVNVIRNRIKNKDVSSKINEKKNIQRLKAVYTSEKIMQSMYKKQKMSIILTNALGVVVCPYCNRNFINNRDDKLGSQMDHFYSKDDYPIFSVSLYNLIPVCGVCNLNKGKKFFNIHPFLEQNNNDDVVFNYLLKSLTEVEVTIDTSESRLKDIEIIKLKESYQIHQLDINNMLDREERYSNRYREELQEFFNYAMFNNYHYDFDVSLTNDEIDRLIHGDFIFEEDVKNISLGKFKKDIFSEIKKMRKFK